MREMKDSGVEWIGEIPNNWEVEKVRNIFQQRSSKGNESAILLSATQSNGMRPQSELDGVVQVKTDTDLQQFKTVHKNDFVISLRSFQGGFEMSDFEGVCSPAYQVFFNIKPIYHGFYKLLFKSQGLITQINALTVGIREGKNIKYETFSYMNIPVPRLFEQQAIATYLDTKCSEIDELITLQETMISELQAYKQSVITEAVTKGLDKNVKLKDSGVEWIGEIPEHWNVKAIKKSFKLYAGATPKTDNSNYWNGDIPWITPADYKTEDVIIEKSNRFLTMQGMQSCATTLLPKGSLIFSKRAPIGLVVINNISLCTNQGCIGCVPINANIHYFYFIMSVYTKQFELLGSGTTFKEISSNNFANFLLPAPSISEQQTIGIYLDQKTTEIDSLITIKKQKIAELKEYKKSIIFEYVTGKKEVPAEYYKN